MKSHKVYNEIKVLWTQCMHKNKNKILYWSKNSIMEIKKKNGGHFGEKMSRGKT